MSLCFYASASMIAAAAIVETVIVPVQVSTLSGSFFHTGNLAIVPEGDLIVLDVDGEVGQQTFAGLALPPTATVLTSRGLHAYYM
jgi:hypothetical protein